MSNAAFPAMFDSSIHRSWPRNNWWGIVGGWEVRVSQRWHWGIFLEFLGGILLRWFSLTKNLLEIREWIFSEGCSIIFRKKMFFFVEVISKNGYWSDWPKWIFTWRLPFRRCLANNIKQCVLGQLNPWISWLMTITTKYDKRLYFSV